MNCGGTEKIASSGPFSEVSSIHTNGRIVTSVIEIRTTYQNAVSSEPLRPGAARRIARPGGQLDGLGDVDHQSASARRSSSRTLTIEKISVISSRTIAIADA